ncbi:glycosyl hydrolase [Acidaminobacter sp. JC074]|uniref:glycoside hydrolase family 3 C-terminal domain-containing protein n=1 Tax=Acidaminobacter sp. JC074 TaxID=2530199 RepID=UPI001F0DF2C3|nr:glycoside hydrolase family 3 C-terminal domain-containing protein [Acidaminobacter sp. JC074]MCH4888960.1 glycosyl hydrolase [Acidaminobacter sp. JC074]
MSKKVNEWLKELTLEEKASLCSGKDFWTTQDIERLGIPSIMVTDGPHGLRKQAGESDHLGLNESIKTTCFPSGVSLASSWDRDLLEEVGKALGEESQSEDVSVLLGPGVNIKRSPLCGRNFEYFSEDPYLSSQIAKHHILGVQSQGVGTSIKHFAANNQEYKRMNVDTIVDERTLREIYLASFETAIKEAKPWTVMSAYNKLNGVYCSDNHRLLTEILRDEWGYEGLVISDWGAEDDRIQGIKAGMDLEMPGNGGRNDQKIVDAVNNSDLSGEALDKVVARVLDLAYKGSEKQNQVTYDKKEHDDLAKKVASECMVLLKNDHDILPLSSDQKIAVLGELAVASRYQGGGSSHINPTYLHSALDSLQALGNISYAKGYNLSEDQVDDKLVDHALELVHSNDLVVIFAGLPERYESEGYDRSHMSIPENQLDLIDRVSQVSDKVVVVLANGSPIEMPWVDQVQGLLEGYLGGQAGGAAIADILYGHVNPSGKLAETFPIKMKDNPSSLNFPGKETKVMYQEGIFVGYRYYEAKEMKTLFSFGHGLSYTSFEYSNLSLDKDQINDTEFVTLSVDIKNTGNRLGKEVVQVYVKEMNPIVIRPEKELKEFVKVELKPGQIKTVTFKLSKRAFAYYNVDIKDWHVATGDFKLMVGSSVDQIHLERLINVTSTQVIKKVYTRNTSLDELKDHPVGKAMVDQVVGKIAEMMGGSGVIQGDALEGFIASLTLRNLLMFGGMSETELEGLIYQLNQ